MVLVASPAKTPWLDAALAALRRCLLRYLAVAAIKCLTTAVLLARRLALLLRRVAAALRARLGLPPLPLPAPRTVIPDSGLFEAAQRLHIDMPLCPTGAPAGRAGRCSNRTPWVALRSRRTLSTPWIAIVAHCCRGSP